jgi:hypothetical protein
MDRRAALRSGLLGLGMTGVTTGSMAASGAAGGGEPDPEVVEALRNLQSTMQRQADAQNAHWRVVRQVQEQQRTFLKASHHFPEFVEVGARAWEGLIEWHVREQVPLNVTRAADGRYTMAFMFSTVLLRPDLDDNYVGFGFDNERPAR